jgi:hypothetical protein
VPSAPPSRRHRAPRALLLGALLLAAQLSACVAHHHVVGLGATGSEEQSLRQYYLLFGLIRVNEVNVQRLASDLTSYEIASEFSFVDLLLAPILLPLTATSRTVTVRT